MIFIVNFPEITIPPPLERYIYWKENQNMKKEEKTSKKSHFLRKKLLEKNRPSKCISLFV